LAGRQILGIFMRHRIAVSGMLQRNNFFDVRDGDFHRRYRYQLTATGFAAGQTIGMSHGLPIDGMGR
jgi:hypothetical protein